MMPRWLPEVGVGLVPVLVFLGALLYLDSYKLVKLRAVMLTVVAGALAGGASYFANGAILAATGIDWTAFSRYVAPLVEEALKGLIILVLIRMRRIGFLVDAAILGFAVGTGFSILENVYYFVALVSGDAGIATWIIRGFGTAIMHGGATAILAVTTPNVFVARTFSKAHGLAVERCVFTRGRSPFRYLRPLKANLFLSMNEADVRDALDAGFPAAAGLAGRGRRLHPLAAAADRAHRQHAGRWPGGRQHPPTGHHHRRAIRHQPHRLDSPRHPRRCGSRRHRPRRWHRSSPALNPRAKSVQDRARSG